MERRDFLRNGSLAGIGLTAARHLVLGQSNAINKKQADLEKFNDDFILNETTIDNLREKMESGELTAVMITDMYLKRIHDLDKSGPMLNAVIEINPDALTIAASLDRERKSGKVRGSLHGIPVLVKDNINTGDKMMTTAGSLALQGNIATADAFIIQRLRSAGAVLLGKTNLSEWANFRSQNSTSGWSSRGGQTKCPYILDRNPSGSSAGSGSATAANFCTLSIGTETDGSIVSPSSVNGLVGIKPTVGLWSRSGIIPISATQDTAGPMARSVRDAAILLGALSGVDTTDKITAQSKGKSYQDYTPFLDKNGLNGKRIGVEKSHLKGHEQSTSLFKEAIRTIQQAGAVIVEIDLLKNIKDAVPGHPEFQVLCYEFKDGVNRYLSTANSKMKNLEDVIIYNRQHEKEAMPYFKQDTLTDCQEKGGLDSKEYTDALAKSLNTRSIISGIMSREKLDGISGITNGPACCIDLINGDYDTGHYFSAPAAVAGFPHITVPMGFVHGLPVGISFFGEAYQEPKLLGIAYSYEQVSKKRAAPEFKQNLLG